MAGIGAVKVSSNEAARSMVLCGRCDTPVNRSDVTIREARSHIPSNIFGQYEGITREVGLCTKCDGTYYPIIDNEGNLRFYPKRRLSKAANQLR